VTTLIPLRSRRKMPTLSADKLLKLARRENLSLPREYLSQALALLAQSIMEIEVSRQIAAERYERRGSRRTYRNGYRKRLWQTRIGEVLLEIPKLRSSSYFPEFLKSSTFEAACLEFVLRYHTQEATYTDVADFLDSLEIEAEPHEIAQLQEDLYDLRMETLTTGSDRLALDWLPYEEEGERMYLAIALDEDQLLYWQSTPYLNDSFWRQFVRRIEQYSAQPVDASFRHTLPTMHMMHTKFSPQMALAA